MKELHIKMMRYQYTHIRKSKSKTLIISNTGKDAEK